MRRSALIIAVIGIAAVLCVVFAAQRKAMWNTRAENATLRSAREEAARLTAENLQMSALQSAAAEVEALRTSNQPLPKLRNQVRQLRAEKTDLERLHAENQRLAAATPPVQPARLSEMEGYVPRETWTRAGFATPEAAVQTWFWATQQQSIQHFAECMSSKMKEEFLREFESKSPEEQERIFTEGLGPFAKMQGYRIASRQEVSENNVVLGIQAAAGGQIMKIPVERFGSEWKLHEPMSSR